MILETFIQQLRLHAPIFQGRVAGAAEFNAGLRNYNTSQPLPAAYVLPLGEEAEPNQVWNGLVQIVHMHIGVAVELDAQTDRRGQAPTMLFDGVRTQIFASVLNLEIGECRMVRGTSYAGARYLDLDRARLFYQFEFSLDWQITDADGVQPESIPLQAIDVDIHLEPLSEHPDPAAVVHIVTAETC